MVDFYDIIIELKDSSERIEKIGILEEELSIFMEQFSYHIATIDGIIVHGVDDCKVFQVIEKNFKNYKYGEYTIGVEARNHNGEPCVEEVKIDSLQEIKRDITNQILTEYNIRAWYYKRMGNVILEGRNLYVDNRFISKLDENRKPIELMKLILEIPYKDKFTYDELKEFYDISKINFQELSGADFHEIPVREIIGKKIKSCYDKTGIIFIEISPHFISLWKEKEA